MNQTVPLLVFSLDQQNFGVHLSQVERIVRAVEYALLPDAPPFVLGVIDVQGNLVPLLDVRRRFGFGSREVGLDDQFIIATASGRRVALAVEKVKGVVERPQTDIVEGQRILPHLEQVEGVLQLEDGLTLIHDLDRFLSLEEQTELEQAITRRSGHG